jgi:pilus assembly protein CpaE
LENAVTETRTVTVAVVDDDERARQSLCALLEIEGLQVVARAGQGQAAAELVRDAEPEIVFVAFERPILRAVQTVDYLSLSLPGSTVLAYAASDDVAVFQQAIRAGARHLLHAPVRPADVQRVLAAALGTAVAAGANRGVGHVISVVGQKGGIGKTAISVNLAAVISSETKGSVLIVDFDTSFGDVGLALDTQSPATVAQAATGLAKLDADAFKESLSEHASGAFVLSAPAHVGEWLQVRPNELEALVELGASLFDYVVVDTPGAYNDAVAAAVAVSDTLLIVTSLEVTSVKNTSLLLAILETEGYPEGRLQVVANNTVMDTGLKITDTAPVLERTSIWNVPYDAEMRRSGTAGAAHVLHRPDSLASQSIRALANRIVTEPERIDRRKTLREETPQRRASFRARLKAALGGERIAS